MKIIKTRLRNKMEDDFLANNLLVNIEGDILETYKHDDSFQILKPSRIGQLTCSMYLHV